jgi:hypothetical protein
MTEDEDDGDDDDDDDDGGVDVSGWDLTASCAPCCPLRFRHVAAGAGADCIGARAGSLPGGQAAGHPRAELLHRYGLQCGGSGFDDDDDDDDGHDHDDDGDGDSGDHDDDVAKRIDVMMMMMMNVI